MRRLLAIVGLGALATVGLAAAFASSGLASEAGADPQVFVCKYVGTPGVDERLQTGDNPINVSANTIKEWNGQNPGNLVGLEFADRHGRSIVIAVDTGQPEPDVSECPGPVPPPEAKGTLVVDKVVVNDNGGTKVASDFSFTVDGKTYAFEADGSNSLVKDPGSYTVAEVAAAGYTSSIDDGTVTVVDGQTVTVTITNDDVAPAAPPTGDASVVCVLPDGYYRVNGRIDGQAADSVVPTTIPGNAKGVTHVVVTRGDTSHRATVTTEGDCGNAPQPPATTPPEPTPTVPAPPETTPTVPPPVTPPVTPPTKPSAPPKGAKPTSRVAGATKTLPAPRPTVRVKGAYKAAPPGLAYTP